MIFLYILAAILLVLFIFLMLSVSAEVKFDEGLTASIKVAGIKVYEYPPAMKKILKKEKRKADKKEKPKEKEKPDLIKKLKPILKFALSALKRAGKMLSHLKLKRLDFFLTVSSEDAFKTSMYYGEICSVVYPVNAIISSFTDPKKVRMLVSADYDVINPELKFYFNGKLRIIFAVSAAIMIMKDFLKSGILKGENDNERK